MKVSDQNSINDVLGCEHFDPVSESSETIYLSGWTSYGKRQLYCTNLNLWKPTFKIPAVSVYVLQSESRLALFIFLKQVFDHTKSMLLLMLALSYADCLQ